MTITAAPLPGRLFTARVNLALVAVICLLAAEVVVAWLSHSLALLGDAGHLLTDSASLSLAAYAMHQAEAPATATHTFGRRRLGILVAGVNGLALLVIALGIAAVAVLRLLHPAPVLAHLVIPMALIALGVNAALFFLLRADAEHELSVHSALLHIMADGVAASGVLLSGVIILLTKWNYADPIASILIAVLITFGAVRLLRETAEILGERTPHGIEAENVQQSILKFPGVSNVHDLHIWSLDRRHRALSAHVLVDDRPLAEITQMLRDIETSLCGEFGIEHVTIQPESAGCVMDTALYCDMDERHELAHSADTDQ